MPEDQVLAGWGASPSSAASVEFPATEAEVIEAIAGHGPRGLIGRGLGRAYGDAALNSGGTVLVATPLAGLRSLDTGRGVAVVGAGTCLEDLLVEILPLGWFVPVTPGTRQVTIGGAVAADIHGKNHHHSGSLGDHVLSITLVDGSGRTRRLSPTDDAALFWATVGGMGLTGIICEVELQLLAVTSSRMLVDTFRIADVDDLLEVMEAHDRRHPYSVAWIDLVRTGRSLGRAVLTVGDHAPREALPARQRGAALDFQRGPRVEFPIAAPSAVVNRVTFRALNEAWYRRAPRQRTAEVQSIGAFFHPLDALQHWNRFYGRAGFVQWQPVVPFEAVDVMRALIVQIAESDVVSTLGVLKRMGPANRAPLSFPMAGWTLAADFPVGHPELGRLLDDLDEKVAAAGGRIYLAKDSRMRPELIPVMYPRLDEWRAAATEADPARIFRSDLDRRLQLRSPAG